MTLYDLCPSCGSPGISHYLKCRDHLVSGEYFELYRCHVCGLIFTQGHPDASDIGRYYESDEYVSHSNTPRGLLNFIYLVVRKIMLNRKVRFIKVVSGVKKGTLLDIGCGTGHFANAMRKAGFNVTGIEVNVKARGYAISKFGLDVMDEKNISSLSSGSFDVITLWHVLEHFHDPYGYFNEIRRLLKTDGLCVVAIPNSSSSDAGHYGEYWAAYDVPRHLWHFSHDAFRSFCEKAGFRLSGTSMLPFDVFYISVLSEKYSGNRNHFVKGLYRGMLFFLRSLSNKEKQSSIIYIVKRSKDQ